MIDVPSDSNEKILQDRFNQQVGVELQKLQTTLDLIIKALLTKDFDKIEKILKKI